MTVQNTGYWLGCGSGAGELYTTPAGRLYSAHYLRESQSSRLVEIECVLDLTYLGDVVGIEVLDLRKQLGGGSVSSFRAEGKVRWSYDDKIDALYIYIGHGSGQVQRSATATAHSNAQQVWVPGIPV